MHRELEYIIGAEKDGCLLRDILRRELGISAKLLTNIKKTQGALTLNDAPVFVNVRVSEGDTVRVRIADPQGKTPNLIPVAGKLDIRYEDKDMVIINKPAGIPVQPSIGETSNSLGNIFVWHYQQKGENILYRPCNRLDSCTSGLMVVAKNSHTQTKLISQLHTGSFKRVYKAIVHGETEEKGCIELPIDRVSDSVIKHCVSEKGKWAKTNYACDEKLNGFSLVTLELESGRTHQIRVHMSHISHPLAGDFLYGKEEPEIIGRCALHSYAVELIHPITGEKISVTCELPKDMQELVEKLRKE